MVGALADILRYTVKNAGGTASISEEIAWLKQYIMLQSAKFGKLSKGEKLKYYLLCRQLCAQVRTRVCHGNTGHLCTPRPQHRQPA